MSCDGLCLALQASQVHQRLHVKIRQLKVQISHILTPQTQGILRVCISYQGIQALEPLEPLISSSFITTGGAFLTIFVQKSMILAMHMSLRCSLGLGLFMHGQSLVGMA